MIPRSLARLIMGRGATELRAKRPPIRYALDPELVARAQADPRVRHDLTAGGFVVVDDQAEATPPAVVVTAIPESTAVTLADEARRLASGVEE